MRTVASHAGWIGLVTILPQLWLTLSSGLGPAQLRNAGLLLLVNIAIALTLCLLFGWPARRLPLLRRAALRPWVPASLLMAPQALLFAHRHVSEERIGGNTRDLIYALSLLAALLLALLLSLAVHRAGRSFPGRVFLGSAALGLLLVATGLVLPEAALPDAREGSPNILLVVLDALRADALGCYGNELGPSPVIDGLAAEGLLFENSFSSSSSSVPGHTSLLWGLEVAEHGAPSNRYDLPAEMPPSLADRLRERGYRSFGICQNPLINATAGFAQGFDYYWSWSEQGRGSAPWQESLLALPAVEIALKLSDVEPISLRATRHFSTREPWFGFVQFLYTHDPYVDADRWATAERVARIREWIDAGEIRNTTDYGDDEIAAFIAKYYGSVAYSDRLVGELLDELEFETRENTVVILTSDHGETLAEHGHEGAGKHFGYHNASLRIPLIVHDPRRQLPLRVAELTSLDKVADIALALADADVPDLRGIARKDRNLIFSAPYLIGVTDSLKVVLHSRELDDGPTVYRWHDDPYDEKPRLHDSLATVVELTDALLESWEKIEPHFRPAADEDLRPEKLERLKALGYVE